MITDYMRGLRLLADQRSYSGVNFRSTFYRSVLLPAARTASGTENPPRATPDAYEVAETHHSY